MSQDNLRAGCRNDGEPDWTPGLGGAVRMKTSQAELLGSVLSWALYNDPGVAHIIPDQQTRRAVLPWYFRAVAIPTSQLYGEIYTTANVQGGALWISPRHVSSFWRVLKTRLLAMPFKLGRATLKRWTNLNAHLQWVHEQLLAQPHWYLMTLGVEPSPRGREISGTLIEPVLWRADSDHLPCYLETFHEPSLSFYEEHGFRIAGGGQIPGGGPNFWSMVRRSFQNKL
jgi:hypothetical protein